MRVPFLDLGAQDARIGSAVRAAVVDVMRDQRFVLGPHLERFEAAMAHYCGVAHALGVGSGTDALLLALGALGAGPGARIVTTPFTFFATASTIVRAGATPIFVDVDPHTLNLDTSAVADALDRESGRIAGVLPVHLFGRLAAVDELTTLAERHGVWLLEDAAQAIGARKDGRAAGSFGAAGCLSFYPTKNLGGIGDGGMVLTGDPDLAARVRRDRHQGQTVAYRHEALGLCSRLDAVQAAALAVKLPHLDAWNARRRTVGGWYTALLTEAGVAGRTGAPVVTPIEVDESHAVHQYVVRARERDALRRHLDAAGVETQIYYALPLHLQPALAHLGYGRGAFPEAERAADEVLALPVYPEIERTQVERVVDGIVEFYRGRV